MNLFLGILFLLVIASLIAISIYYIFVVSKGKTKKAKFVKKTKPGFGGKQKRKPKSEAKKLKRPPGKTLQKNRDLDYIQNKIGFPDDIPRTWGTIRIIAKEDPMTVVRIIKKWLK